MDVLKSSLWLCLCMHVLVCMYSGGVKDICLYSLRGSKLHVSLNVPRDVGTSHLSY
jgi:hypothetical protein